MAFADDKNCCLDKIRAFDCDSVSWVDDNLNSYDDIIPVFLSRYLKLECFPDYTYSLFACFDSTELEARGIYYNSTETTLTDPVLIIKTTATDITLNIASGAVKSDFVIYGASTVDTVTVDGGGTLNCLSVSAGGNLKLLSTTGGSNIRLVRSTACRMSVSKLDAVTYDSLIGRVVTSGGGFYGGFRCADPGGVCSSEVTALATTKVTSSSITLTWTVAADTINTIVYYRLNNDPVWLLAGDPLNVDGVDGNYTQDALGYIFRSLKVDTYYDFKVVNVCADGNYSAGVTITEKTTTL